MEESESTEHLHGCVYTDFDSLVCLEITCYNLIILNVKEHVTMTGETQLQQQLMDLNAREMKLLQKFEIERETIMSQMNGSTSVVTEAPTEEVVKILERSQVGMGPLYLSDLLEKHYGITISKSSLFNILMMLAESTEYPISRISEKCFKYNTKVI